MRVPYEPSEVLFLQTASADSAADALNLTFGPVPEKKCWTFHSLGYFPGVAETRTVWFTVVHPNGSIEVPLIQPVSIALTLTRGLPLLLAGDEFSLLPGQRIKVYRDAATAGSIMYIRGFFIETDVPIYQYIEPQEQRRIKRRATGLIMGRPTGGGGHGGGSAGGVMGFPVGTIPTPPPK